MAWDLVNELRCEVEGGCHQAVQVTGWAGVG